MILSKKIVSKEIYLISDLHANLPLFKESIKELNLNKDYLFILGDLIEKGNFNIEMLDYLIYLTNQYKEHVYILSGNCDLVVNEFKRPANKEKLLRYSLILGKTILNEFLEGIGIDIYSNYDIDLALDKINVKYKKYFDFINNLPKGFFINDKVLLTHADLSNSITKGLLTKEDFEKFNYSLNVVGHLPVMMYKKNLNMNPLLKDKVLYIDGGNQVVEFGGLNLVKLNLDNLKYSFKTNYNLLKYVVKFDQEESGDTYVAEKTEVEKYEKLDDFYNVWINNKKLFVSKRNLVNNKYSYDATDIFLKLNKGDIVLGAFIGKTYSFVIKDNTCGLTYTANLEVF